MFTYVSAGIVSNTHLGNGVNKLKYYKENNVFNCEKIKQTTKIELIYPTRDGQPVGNGELHTCDCQAQCGVRLDGVGAPDWTKCVHTLRPRQK